MGRAGRTATASTTHHSLGPPGVAGLSLRSPIARRTATGRQESLGEWKRDWEREHTEVEERLRWKRGKSKLMIRKEYRSRLPRRRNSDKTGRCVKQLMSYLDVEKY